MNRHFKTATEASIGHYSGTRAHETFVSHGFENGQLAALLRGVAAWLDAHPQHTPTLLVHEYADEFDTHQITVFL